MSRASEGMDFINRLNELRVKVGFSPLPVSRLLKMKNMELKEEFDKMLDFKQGSCYHIMRGDI